MTLSCILTDEIKMSFPQYICTKFCIFQGQSFIVTAALPCVEEEHSAPLFPTIVSGYMTSANGSYSVNFLFENKFCGVDAYRL